MTSRLDLGTDLCDALDRVSMTDGIVLNTQEGPSDVDVHFLIREVDQDAREPVQNFPHYLSWSAQKSQAICTKEAGFTLAPRTQPTPLPHPRIATHHPNFIEGAQACSSSSDFRPTSSAQHFALCTLQLVRPKHGAHVVSIGERQLPTTPT